MKSKVISTTNAPAPLGPYSQGRTADGPTLWVAGQVPINPSTGEFTTGPIGEQALQAFENLKAVIEAAGAELTNIVKVNLYLADLSNGPEVNAVYESFFPDPKPARTTIGAALPAGLQVEIDCVVAL